MLIADMPPAPMLEMVAAAGSESIATLTPIIYYVNTDNPTNKTQDIDWLNAYNAPHWMQYFQSIPLSSTNKDPTRYAGNSNALPGWRSDQFGKGANDVELFGTSWMRDLMVAKQFAPSAWVQPSSLFKGTTDANHGYTPRSHATHDLGMAMDLSIADYTSAMFGFTSNVPSQQVQAVQMVDPGHWSNSDAGKFLQALQTNKVKERQDLALADFFSLYAVTQKGANGSRDALKSQVKGSKDTDKVLNALFGDGTQKGGLINGVIIGGDTWGEYNTYPDIRYALTQLGFRGPAFNDKGQFIGSKYPQAKTMPTLANVFSHHHHFHIYLQPPAPVTIDKTALLQVADASGDRTLVKANTAQKKTAAPTKKLTPAIVRKIENKFNLDRNKRGGNCILYSPEAYQSSGWVLPALHVFSQLKYVYNIEITTPIKTRVTQPPKYGVMKVVDYKVPLHHELASNAPGQMYSEAYQYVPDPAYYKAHDYSYEDWVSFEIDVNGHTFHFKYVIDVHNNCDSYYPLEDDLGQGLEGGEPTIRLTLESVTSSLQDDVENDATALDGVPMHVQAFDSSDIPALLSALGLPNLAQVGFDNLTGAAVGSTTGTTITLDDNAAGYGWFIDYTPGQNEEFLPTSNPNEWVANPGSEAEGKMDLLTVLLHEYGHALGLDHSADPDDFMATTLQPGQRRTLSADEQLMLMRLTGYFPTTTGSDPSTPTDPFSPFLGAPLLFGIGRLRGTQGTLSPTLYPYGAPRSQGERGLSVDYAIAANPTLTDAKLQTGAGWETSGKVAIGQGAAVLTEDPARQTRLNQVFIVGPNDRYLTFTVADIELDDVTSSPDDAFEAALLDANSGATLLAGTGLTRNDAFLE